MTAPTDTQSLSMQHATTRETDEGLVTRLRRGEEDALRSLHHRYAALVFTVAARFVDAATAEDVVQDVFVTLWKKHATFDPARGSFKNWIVQITRRRALNELRRKQGRGQHSDESLTELAADSLEPDEAQWLAHRTMAIRAAVDALPSAQKQALSLAFFDELTHEQIASLLDTPVGTTKTRIRSAIKRLAPVLVALMAASAVLLFVRWREERAALHERALRMVLTSDVVPLRLGAAPGVPAEAHGSYRARPGTGIAVLTTSNLPAIGANETYFAWVHRTSAWQLLGTVVVESNGISMLVSEIDPSAAPDEVRITRELGSAGDGPRGSTVLSWSLAGL